uniref:C3HC-type domain-containing protein n=1 Tax=Neospora caninum (strain Liverpool) TaxID=572307 RepID=A0A0F7UEB2_NEOCL|nr:TPA: hypothetical protein BN1204_024825 [Neospora caninum Liverpool]
MTGTSPPVSPVNDALQVGKDANVEKLGRKGPAAEYRELLLSFYSETQKWFAPPPSLSPFLLARAGFACTDTGVIQCPLCGEKWTWRKRRVRRDPPSTCSTAEHEGGNPSFSETKEQIPPCTGRRTLRKGCVEREDAVRPCSSRTSRGENAQYRRRDSSNDMHELADEEEDSEMIDAVALSFVHSECCPRRGIFISLFDVDLAGLAVMPLTLVQDERSRLKTLRDCLGEKARQGLPLISLRSALGYLSSLILSKAECLRALRENPKFLDLDTRPLSLASDSAEQTRSSSTRILATKEQRQESEGSSEASSAHHSAKNTPLSLLLQLLILLFRPCLTNPSVPNGDPNTDAAVLTEIILSGRARGEAEQRKRVRVQQENGSVALSLATAPRSVCVFFPAEGSLDSLETARKFLQSLSHSEASGENKLSLADILGCVVVDPLKVLALFGWGAVSKSTGEDAEFREKTEKSFSLLQNEGRVLESKSGAMSTCPEKSSEDLEQKSEEATEPEQNDALLEQKDVAVECRYCLRRVALGQFRQYAVQSENCSRQASQGERSMRERMQQWMQVCAEYSQFYCQAWDSKAVAPTSRRRAGEFSLSEEGKKESGVCEGKTDFVLGTYLPAPRVGREPSVFDPVLEHRLHCPYISGAVYGGQAVVERVISALLPLQIRGFEQARAREELRKEAMDAWSWRKNLETRK